MKLGVKSRWYQRPLFRSFLIGVAFCLIFGISYNLNRLYLQRATDLQRVVVARQPIKPNTKLTAQDLILSERPVFALGQDFAQDMSEFLTEQVWYTGELGLGQGDVLRPSRLTQIAGDQVPLLERLVSEGKRLITVETDLVRSCANWLEPGVRVDALVFIKGKEGLVIQPDQVIGPAEDAHLKNLLVVDKKNIEGLALVGADPVSGAVGASQDKLPVAVTLLLDQQDEDGAKTLIRYNEQGKIYFSPVGLAAKP